MAATVSFEVYSLREGHWNLDSVYDDRGLALDEARHMLKRRHEKGVKVVKENYDDETNKLIPTTIFHEGGREVYWSHDQRMDNVKIIIVINVRILLAIKHD